MVHALACPPSKTLALRATLPALARHEVRGLVEMSGRQMRADLEALRTARCHADLWQLTPTWAWVWLAEAGDAATWARTVRWAQQIAARRSDPTPLAALLARFAAKHGEVATLTK